MRSLAMVSVLGCFFLSFFGFWETWEYSRA